MKKGETAYYERKQEADLIFAVNGAGSYFGDVDFTLSSRTTDAKRFYSVKALSDVTVLALHKKDLYTLDEEFLGEVQEFFRRSEKHERKLRDYLRRANEWYYQSRPISEEAESAASQPCLLEEINEEDEENLERELTESVKKKRQTRASRVLNVVKIHTETNNNLQWKGTEESSRFSKQLSSVLGVNEEIEDKSLSQKLEEIQSTQ